MAFPSTLSTFNHPAASDRLNNPSHSALHNTVSSALGQVEAVIGTDASTIGTIIGDLRNPLSAGGGHVQTAVTGGTGQTTYTKGDLLAASSSSVLTKLAVGLDGAVLKANSSVATGVQWGSLPGNPVVRVYSGGGTGGGGSSLLAIWNRPSVLSYAVIEVVGGGGGGGGTTTANESSGGGGGGGFSRKTVIAANLPLAASMIGGKGGLAGAGTGGVGGTGGTTYFGSVISATGGVGGTINAEGGDGGLGVGGDVNIAGQGGGSGFSAAAPAGSGGSSHYGGGGAGIGTAGTPKVGGLYGGGGGGGKSSGPDAPGAVGADGVIIVYEY